MALANLSIYYIWKNIKSEYSNNKFKISAPSWKDTFDVTNGNITLKDFRKYEKLEYEKNKLKLVIDFLNNCKQLGVYPEHKLELLTLETMKLLGSTKTFIKTEMEKIY